VNPRREVSMIACVQLLATLAADRVEPADAIADR
jgi:hypothetical protein